VFDIVESALVLRAVAPDVTIDEVRERTDATFIGMPTEVAK
jgi:acyl CoA:acetate/3-ketoacid CoA transferase beta subunit